MQKTTTKECRTHGLTEFALEGSGYYRCKKCRSQQVTARRRKVKTLLVEAMGCQCVLCGYCKCQEALQFHHLDPDEKSFGLSESGATIALAKLLEEAKKCVLLCANCHAEVEAGIVTIDSPVVQW